jgi:hypothetical protein
MFSFPKFSTEILKMILQSCVIVDSRSGDIDVYQQFTQLLDIMLVCKRFRSVLLPIAWHSVVLDTRALRDHHIGFIARLMVEPLTDGYRVQDFVRRIHIRLVGCNIEICDIVYILTECRNLCHLELEVLATDGDWKWDELDWRMVKILTKITEKLLNVSRQLRTIKFNWDFVFTEPDVNDEIEIKQVCLDFLHHASNVETIHIVSQPPLSRVLEDAENWNMSEEAKIGFQHSLMSLQRVDTVQINDSHISIVNFSNVISSWSEMSKNLTVFEFKYVDDSLVESIAANCKNLTSLTLSKIDDVSDSTACELVDQLTNLTVLEFSDGKLSNKFLQHLANRGQNYRVLRLHNAGNFSGDGIDIVQWMNLFDLEISKITDQPYPPFELAKRFFLHVILKCCLKLSDKCRKMVKSASEYRMDECWGSL